MQRSLLLGFVGFVILALSSACVPLANPTHENNFTPAIPEDVRFQAEEQISLDENCIKPFPEFAYTFWGLENTASDVQIILPPSPWQIETTIPIQRTEGYYSPHIIEAVFSRATDKGQEIWITQEMLSVSTPGGKIIYSVYLPALGSWESISANIEDTEYYASDLFVTKDGSVWGSTARDYYLGDPAPEESVSVLSKFNEHTMRFEFAPGALNIHPLLPDDPKVAWAPYFAGIDIVLDKEQNIFWIFSEEDGIYRYEPAVQITQKWLDLPDLKVSSPPALSPDGSIFVQDFRPERMTEPYFHLYEGSLFHFFPDRREFVQLEMPDEPWPMFAGWLVTQTGRLWLGTVGYREPNGSWYLLHPDATDYFRRGGEQTSSPPYLMLESSDGRLWYQKYLNMGPRFEGTAWYNPATGEGCMFTNLPVNIIEDAEQHLWLVANEKLYRYKSKP